MFEVLLYLFENYMNDGVNLICDKVMITDELIQEGFTNVEINSALEWLDGLRTMQIKDDYRSNLSTQAIRHYAAVETQQLGLEGIGFLLYLEQSGVLDPLTREIVIDRLMVFDYQDIDLERIKWVILIALFNQPEKKTALSFLQDMILSETYDVLH